MFFELASEQSFACRVLSGHIQQGRLAHTYLFSGDKGTNKETLALAFSCGLLSGKDDFSSLEEDNLYERIESGNHPDVIHVGRDPKVKSIKIDEVRSCLKSAALKPFESAYKIYIIHQSDRLTLDASNALLKTLEEPPAHTLFILLVDSKDHLLPTIQSRAFEIRMAPRVQAERDVMQVRMNSLQGIGRLDWVTFFEQFEKKTRIELQEILGSVAFYLREKIQLVSKNKRMASDNLTDHLKAIDYVLETKEAVGANANQKLSLTRLSMQLSKKVPVG